MLQKVVDGINVISEGNQQFTTTYGQTFYNSELNRAFVQFEYFGYLRRDPDDAGYAFWLGKLNQFNGDFVAAEMVLAFISSPEYRARFGSPNVRTACVSGRTLAGSAGKRGPHRGSPDGVLVPACYLATGKLKPS